MRTSGILMPIFSLSNSYGIGSLGKCAYSFVDFLKKSGQSLWQILPIGHTGFGDSPYQTFSCFAGNPYFIDLDLLCEEGLLKRSELEEEKNSSERIDYGRLYNIRYKTLHIAFSRFKASDAYYKFCSENADWLDSYCVFMTLKELHGGARLSEFGDFHGKENGRFKTENADIMDFYRFLQYKFFEQWNKLHEYASRQGIQIIGDIPIYASGDSADVFEYPELFSVDSSFRPIEVAGCPPDSFSADGQLWGNPVYNWEKMKEDGYAWFIRRIKFNLELFDILRIDHFRGFQSYFSIPANAVSAKAGEWKKGPSEAFFDKVFESLGRDLPIIAEDLGFLSEDVRSLLAFTGFAGMKVLQFAFDSREESDYLPHNYDKNCVVYTGTHDNDTLLGWVESISEADLQKAKDYTRTKSGTALAEALTDLALSSVAERCILCMPDILSLGRSARINTPGTLGNNWRWRIKSDAITPELYEKLLFKTKLYGRALHGN
ncbi:MAG: 4-alpha-glucanotransferase [Clostridiales bacterium]|nr:4-alpha-glucanotransferase [Candidatus Equinaster intestinalis]